jgi:hypothetical protein
MFTTVDYPRVRIPEEIERLFARNHIITIASAYKGLILTHPIQVLDILPDRVVFRAPDPLLCFTLREKVHLYSHTLSEAITARLLEINMILGKISLCDFTFSGHSWKDRLCERIQPQNLITVDFSNQKTKASAQLKDLSTTGIRFLISRTKNKGVCTNRDATIRLTLRLPRDDYGMDLKGKIIYSQQLGNLVIVGVHFHPSVSQEKRLHQYISTRKAEILNELKSEFQRLIAPRQVQDLYF